MSAIEKLPVSLISDLFSYKPATGLLTWSSHEQNIKRKVAGKAAGSPTRPRHASNVSYIKLAVRIPSIGSTRLYTLGHRLAWALNYGAWPEGPLDHIDGDGCNNAIANLRLADSSTNARNQHLHSTNKSGIAGVVWHKQARKWQASAGRICRATGKRHCDYLGVFGSLLDAAAARKSYDLANGYGPAHGKSATEATA